LRGTLPSRTANPFLHPWSHAIRKDKLHLATQLQVSLRVASGALCGAASFFSVGLIVMPKLKTHKGSPSGSSHQVGQDQAHASLPSPFDDRKGGARRRRGKRGVIMHGAEPNVWRAAGFKVAKTAQANSLCYSQPWTRTPGGFSKCSFISAIRSKEDEDAHENERGPQEYTRKVSSAPAALSWAAARCSERPSRPSNAPKLYATRDRRTKKAHLPFALDRTHRRRSRNNTA